MDQTMMNLIDNERIAQNQLEWAITPDTIQDALKVLNLSRDTIQAYRIYKKKEYEYKLAVQEKDRNLKILNDVEEILKNT